MLAPAIVQALAQCAPVVDAIRCMSAYDQAAPWRTVAVPSFLDPLQLWTDVPRGVPADKPVDKHKCVAPPPPPPPPPPQTPPLSLAAPMFSTSSDAWVATAHPNATIALLLARTEPSVTLLCTRDAHRAISHFQANLATQLALHAPSNSKRFPLSAMQDAVRGNAVAILPPPCMAVLAKALQLNMCVLDVAAYERVHHHCQEDGPDHAGPWLVLAHHAGQELKCYIEDDLACAKDVDRIAASLLVRSKLEAERITTLRSRVARFVGGLPAHAATMTKPELIDTVLNMDT